MTSQGTGNGLRGLTEKDGVYPVPRKVSRAERLPTMTVTVSSCTSPCACPTKHYSTVSLREWEISLHEREISLHECEISLPEREI